jgi:hypothetical protein
VSEYEMSATGIDRQRVVCDGVDVFAIVGNRIARKDTYLDLAAIQNQLRDKPTPASQEAPA